MKKFIIPIITLSFIISIIFIFSSLNTTKNITSEVEINVITEDSKLDILVNLGNFSKENYSERKLLDVAMQYAEKLNLMNELNSEGVYLQYANKDDIHNLINQLTGLTVDAPIEIDDFYYLYDSENSYYYYLGTSPNYYEVSNINTIKRTGNQYTINCSIKKTEDGEIGILENVTVILNYVSKNNIIPYQVEKIIIQETGI